MSAPVWDMAALAPSGLRPDFNTNTGFFILFNLVICLHIFKNSRPFVISSRYMTMTFVCSCSASIFRISTSFRSTLFPILITDENPIPWALASSTSAAQIAPLCDTSAIPPDLGVTLRKVEFIIVCGAKFITPRQFGPMILILYCLAISASFRSSFAPSSLTSLNPAVMTIAPLIPFLPHSSSTAGTTSFFVTIAARSISSGTSRTDLYAFLSNTVSLVGLIGSIFPVYPFSMLDVMARPTLPSLSEAPIIAIDFGDRKIDSLILTRWTQMYLYNKFIQEKRLISKINCQASFQRGSGFVVSSLSLGLETWLSSPMSPLQEFATDHYLWQIRGLIVKLYFLNRYRLQFHP